MEEDVDDRRAEVRGDWALLPHEQEQERENGLKLCRGKFRLEIRENSSSGRAVQPWHCPGQGGVPIPGGI